MKKSPEERFGSRIKQLRNDRGWTQEYLCELCEIGREHISRIENGRKEPCLAVIDALARCFQMSISELMRGV